MIKTLKTPQTPFGETKLIPRNECLYYLVREMDGLGIRAGEKYFEAILNHIRSDGLKDMRKIEIYAVIMAAELRGREQELDEAVDAGQGVL